MVNSFIFSEQYIREKNGKESISLRKIKKVLMFEFLNILTENKKKYKKKMNNSNENNIYITTCNDELIYKYSISIGFYIFLCLIKYKRKRRI